MRAARPSSLFDVPVERRHLGKYELVARIGSGGMAEVHLARLCGPMGFQKVVVIKTIHQHLAQQPQFLNMLLDEARISALIKHPRVVDIYELGEVDGVYFIAMEHLVGEPMSKLMAASASREGPRLDIYSVARIIADTAEGLAAAHDLTSMTGEHLQLVHRDVSPGNIVVLYDGNVKIVDFGVAKARGRITESGQHTLKGKIGYVSPEQVQGGPVDRRSDIFGLGIVLWEALTLRRLFDADTDLAGCKKILECSVPPPSYYRPEVPVSLDAICLRAVARDPDDRFQDAVEMYAALEEMLGQAGQRGRERIAEFMNARFSRRRAARRRVIQQVATASADEELEVDIEFDTDDDSDTDAVPVEAPAAIPRKRRGPGVWLVLAFTALAVAGGAYYLGRADQGATGTPTTRGRTPPAVGAVVSTSPGEPTRAETLPPARDTHTGDRPSQPLHLRRADDTSSEAPPSKSPDEPKSGDAATLTAEASRRFLGGQLGQAQELYKRAIRQRPSYAPAHRGLGMVYQKQGRGHRAIRSFETYLKLAPNANDAAAIRKRIEDLRD